MSDDHVLLRAYAQKRDEHAFAELVQRHLGPVFAAALRQVWGDYSRAQDVTQKVFVVLARKAGALVERPSLTAWLLVVTRNVARESNRAEGRRRRREQEVISMQDEILENAVAGENSNRIREHLDEALASLQEGDREAVVLRYFQERSFAEIGAALRINEDAARMRVGRALERMRAVMLRRGAVATVAALGALMTEEAKAAPPAGLPAAVTTHALAGSVLPAGGGLSATFAWLALPLKISLGTAALVIAVTVGILRNGANGSIDSSSAKSEALKVKSPSTANPKEEKPEPAKKDSSRAESPELAYARSFQKDLAAKRKEKAERRAALAAEVEKMEPAARFQMLLAAAGEEAKRAQFSDAVQLWNQAMQFKPRETELTSEQARLGEELRTQNVPQEVTFTSDGATDVVVQGNRMLGKFERTAVKLLPGDYEVVGRRPGYRDIRKELRVRNLMPVGDVEVICIEAVSP